MNDREVEELVDLVCECVKNPFAYRGGDMPDMELMFDFHKFREKLRER